MTANERSDDELHQQAIAGDREAQDELKSRLLEPLYDFAIRISLDPAVAETATIAALDKLLTDGRRAGMSLNAWGLATVRDETLERLRTRGGAAGDPRGSLSPVDSAFSALSPPDAARTDPELAGWVWQAARSQRPRDYSLLDLAVRRGLSADEIADATDMSHSGIYAILGRLRGLFEETFTSTLLYHRGREACLEVASLATQHAGLGPALRREIARHVEGCTACRQTRRSFPSPAELLAAFQPIEPPQGLPITEAAAESAGDELQVALPLTGIAVDQLEGERDALADAVSTEEPSGAAESAGVELEGDADQAGVEEAEGIAVNVSAASDGLEAVELPDHANVADGEEEQEAVEEPGVREEAPVARSADLTLAMDAGLEDIERRPQEEGAGGGEIEVDAVAPEPVGPGEEAEEREPEPERRPSRRRAPVAAAAGTGSARAAEERLRFERDRYLRGMDAAGPPRRPWDGIVAWFGEQGPARISLTVLFVAALGLAVYLGLALGDSIEGGSDGSAGGGLGALPTTTPGIHQIACGSGTYTIDQGNTYTLAFDSSALPGYQISKIGVLPVSAGAAAQAVQAKMVSPLTVEVEALRLPGAAGRTDEYRMEVAFSKQGTADVTSQCTVLVRAPAATATPQVSPTSAPSATPSPSPRPAATQAPAATQVPPSATPIPVTPSPTYNPTIPTFTPTPPPTSTASATATTPTP